jgi:putative ABC transport system permease protein
MSWDSWQEIFATVRRNKLRTALTGLTVAWGIFMLVILLAAGGGLRNAVENDFRDDAKNSIFISGGETSLPYKGRGPGRHISFTNGDYDTLREKIAGIQHMSGRFYLWGGFSVRYQERAGQFDLRGTHPGHQYLEKTIMLSGRFINDDDVERRRKVAVIGPEVRDFLFRGADPIGEYIDIRGVNYQVVGVFTDQGNQGELKKIYVPISTAQLVYGGADRVDRIMFSVSQASVQQSKEMEARVRRLLHERHGIAPDDSRAVRINNNLERFQRVTDIFDWIRIFVWIVGCGTVVAGIVGVSNIMLISVKERTREIGVRKAVGATPVSIIGLILCEAIALTAIAGYLGLVSAVGVVEFVRSVLPENDYVRDPRVDFNSALLATALVIAAGALAGYFPARKAARVDPAVALRSG